MSNKYLVAFGGAVLVFIGVFYLLNAVIPQQWIFFPGLIPMLGMMGANLTFVALEPRKMCPRCGKFLLKIGATPGSILAYIRGYRSCVHCKGKFDRKGEKLLSMPSKKVSN